MNSKVFFIGAGPGDPELITIKGVNVLKDSEVVIYDRLVNEKILELYCDPNAKKIFVGKQGHTSHSTPQSEINSIILNETEKHEILPIKLWHFSKFVGFFQYSIAGFLLFVGFLLSFFIRNPRNEKKL